VQQLRPDVGQRRATPQPERLGQQRVCPGELAGRGRGLGRPGQRVELGQVELVDGQPDQVAVGRRLDQLAATQRLAQPQHQALHRGARAGRRCGAPDPLGDVIHRHRLVRVQQQHSQ
jgi:hypothetical protein